MIPVLEVMLLLRLHENRLDIIEHVLFLVPGFYLLELFKNKNNLIV